MNTKNVWCLERLGLWVIMDLIQGIFSSVFPVSVSKLKNTNWMFTDAVTPSPTHSTPKVILWCAFSLSSSSFIFSFRLIRLFKELGNDEPWNNSTPNPMLLLKDRHICYSMRRVKEYSENYFILYIIVSTWKVWKEQRFHSEARHKLLIVMLWEALFSFLWRHILHFLSKHILVCIQSVRNTL